MNKKVKSILTLLAAPLAIMVIILISYKSAGAYPFGTATVAWGDMIQQVIPLLVDFKDILAGKAGAFMNFRNAGGMNLWGVIFFFLASPFSFLTIFVKKTQMILFVNIIVMLKLMTCGMTSAIYLKHRCKELSAIWITALSVLYGLSGYGMLYFQNVIWLDMMYLFPILLLTLELMAERKSVVPYAVTLACMMIVNYYIGYMIVIFIMLFAGMTVTALGKDKRCGKFPLYFITGSAAAALMSAVVWLPSLLQYFTSGRVKEEFFSSVKEAGFFTNYQTVLPTVLSSTMVLVFVMLFMSDGLPRSRKLNNYLILAVLLIVPLIIEPINLMWHTGNYMSFPSRFGFMTEFMLVVCTAMFLSSSERKVNAKKYCDSYPILIVLLAAVYFFAVFIIKFTKNNHDDITAYSKSLWANDTSYFLILELFLVSAAVYCVLYAVYKHGYISKAVLSVLCSMLIAAEGYSNCTVYLTADAVSSPDYAKEQQTIYDLADRIDDNEGFYRVKTESKLFYVNLVGPMGYNSISHYTSLNDQDYMFMMKRLGYSANWMDVGSYGGTELTDTLLSIKYTINWEGSVQDKPVVYQNERYAIYPLENYLPSGLIIKSEVSDSIDELLPETTRGDIQEYIFEHTLAKDGEKLITMRECSEPESIKRNDEGDFCFTQDTEYVYNIDVSGRQTIYIDCFEKPQVSLGSPVDDSFEIYVNDNCINGSYPNGNMNGIYKAGSFENESVKVVLKAKKYAECKSFGVFTLDTDMLYESSSAAKTINFTENKGRLTGTYSAQEGESCLIAVPYRDELRLKINGKKAGFRRAFDDMVLIYLQPGENKIEISSVPRGFGAGLFMTVSGIAFCILYHFILGRKITAVKSTESVEKLLSYAVILASAAVFAVIYILPLFLSL